MENSLTIRQIEISLPYFVTYKRCERILSVAIPQSMRFLHLLRR